MNLMFIYILYCTVDKRVLTLNAGPHAFSLSRLPVPVQYITLYSTEQIICKEQVCEMV
jgi:hypothetical protein